MFAVALLMIAVLPDRGLGSWEGVSSCKIKPSPCHHQHVIYRITASEPHHYRIDAYKVIAGKEDFMGAIDVTLDAADADLDGDQRRTVPGPITHEAQRQASQRQHDAERRETLSAHRGR